MDDQSANPGQEFDTDPPERPESGNSPQDPGPEPALVLGEAFTRLRKAFKDQAPQAMTEIIHAYFREAPMLIGQMRTALDQKQPRLLQNSAHTLKSSSAILGAARLAQLCQDLELMAQAEDLSKSREYVAQLNAEYLRVEAVLKNELIHLS
jgi:HPt (histidine-containing phosphotransfer) domain-containing protein